MALAGQRRRPSVWWSPLSGVAIAGALLLATAGSASAAGVSVSSTPGFSPAFDEHLSDYVTTCAAGRVTLRAASPRGTLVKLDVRRPRSGRQATNIAIRPGERLVVSVIRHGVTHAYSIRCLPKRFPSYTVSGKLPSASPFMAFAEVDQNTPSLRGGKEFPYAVVVNSGGVPIWWMRGSSTPFDVKPMGSGRIGFWSGRLSAGGTGPANFATYRADGKKLSTQAMVGQDTDLHELLPTHHSTYFAAAYVRRNNVPLKALGGPVRGSLLEAEIQELTAKRKVVWAWKSRQHISPAETGRWWPVFFGQPELDLFDSVHINSIAEDGRDGVLVSMRNTDALYRIRKSTGAVDWKLGGTTTARSLTVEGDPGVAVHLGAQHDARVLPDGTISVFDNGTALGRRPRVTRWRINTTTRVATLIEKLEDAEVPPSICCGSARRLAGGDWLVAWGGTRFVRAYRSDGSRSFNLKFNRASGGVYRAAPIASRQVSHNQLVAGMDRMHPRR